MNNEFKKIKNNNETRYVLETATAGATSAGVVATAEKELGEVQKRTADATKPRNFVAKNAKMGGAGKHKDKKKEQKQGTAKHKKPYMESLKGKLADLKSRLVELQESVTEGNRPFRGVGGAFNRGDDERHDLDPTDWYFVKDGKMFAVSVYPNQEQEAAARGYSRTRDEAKAKAANQGVAEGEGNQEIGQQMANDGITYSPEKEKEIINLMAQYMQKAGMSSKQIRYLLSYDEDYVPDQLGFLPKQGMAESDAYMESLSESLTSVLQEKAPPGDKYERMVKHIKKGYSKDGKLTDVEKSKAYGAAWKAKNKSKK